jgi:hypothetical protein
MWHGDDAPAWSVDTRCHAAPSQRLTYAHRMNARPPGQPLVLDQLRLELAGVEAASDQELVARWLAEQTEETREVFRAALFLNDHDSRDERAGRWLKLRQLQAPFDTDWGRLIPGGLEAAMLYNEAQRAFINGLLGVIALHPMPRVSEYSRYAYRRMRISSPAAGAIIGDSAS